MFKSNKKEQQETQDLAPVSVVKPEIQPELNSAAFGLVRTPQGWGVAKVAFDLDSGQAKLVNMEWTGESRQDAEYNFKVSVGKNFSETT